MNRKIEAIVAVAFFLFMGTIIIPSLLMASDITVVGEVNDSNQIVADGVVFEVDDTPEGDNLVTNYIGKTVKVTGKLNIEGDMRIIAVKSFKVIEK
ncbi:MAG: hypothetical protein JSV31_27170 [Desulfobacterales bacterium]|nr:MAG: hypothetical protein JSV31_27170 [Desulfobacterales bacterium]